MPNNFFDRKAGSDPGYLADSEDELLGFFKKKFQQKIKNASIKRKSNQNIPQHFRRLDSLARLLECGSVCAAVYYHSPSRTIWMANNQVHDNSDHENDWTRKMYSVFFLVSTEYLSIESIFSELSDIIFSNIQQTYRWGFNEFKKEHVGFDWKKTIQKWLNDFFVSGHESKRWQHEMIQELTLSGVEGIKNQLIIDIFKKAVTLTRDFLKLRQFLLSSNDYHSLADEILSAIRENRISILHVENKDVHAEMRILSEILSKGYDDSEVTYLSLSKLCCDHCALAVQSFDVETRGVHGQRAAWAIPNFMRNNPNYLKQYVGEDAFEAYEQLSPGKQKEAQEFIASKEANPVNENKRHGRDMYASASESDVEFGFACSDDEISEEVKTFSLNDVWQARHIKICYSQAYQGLLDIGLEVAAIVNLFKSNFQKFHAVTSVEFFNFLSEVGFARDDYTDLELFHRMTDIYEENEILFFNMVEDDKNLVVEHGVDEVYDKYKKVVAEFDSCSDVEEIDHYDLAANELQEEDEWDYDYNSDDSQNRWVYKDRDDDRLNYRPYTPTDESEEEFAQEFLQHVRSLTLG